MEEEETMTEQIQRSQRALQGIYEYHQDYLDRRQGLGRATKTDTIMAEHQRQLNEAISLLKWIGECFPPVFAGSYELFSRVMHEHFGLGTVVYPHLNEEDNWIC